MRGLPVGTQVTVFDIGKSPLAQKLDDLFEELKQGIKIEDGPHFMTIKLTKSGKIVTRPYNQVTCDAIRVIEKLRK